MKEKKISGRLCGQLKELEWAAKETLSLGKGVTKKEIELVLKEIRNDKLRLERNQHYLSLLKSGLKKFKRIYS